MNLTPPNKPRPSAADRCAVDMRRAILNGTYPPGTRLPAERRLASDYMVGRETVRSALQRLVAAKLLVARQGSGYEVLDFRERGGPDLLESLSELVETRAAKADMAADLFLLRRHMAAAVFERLSTGVGLAALGAIAAAVQRFEIEVRTGADVAAFALADLAIIQALLDATESPVLRLGFNPLAVALASWPELVRVVYREPAENLVAWKAVLAWLSESTPAHNARAARDILVSVLEGRDRVSLAKLAGRTL